jgi:hypothetical protein
MNEGTGLRTRITFSVSRWRL